MATARSGQKLIHDEATVVLISADCPGYTSYATALLRECLKRDPRLPTLRVATLSFPADYDAWWIAWRIAELSPTPDFVCFSVYCWNSTTLLGAARLVSRLLPEAHIVFGGPEAGTQAQAWLKRYPFIDAIARAEGEPVLPEYVYTWARGGDATTIPGLAARDDTGMVRCGPASVAIDPLDSLPCAYTDAHPAAADGSAYLETYRGCPHSCSYCFEGKGSTHIRSFSWERIAAEIDRLATTPGLQSFSVTDAVFNLNLDRLEKLSDLLAPYAERGLRLHTIEVDLERIDAHQARLLKRAGVVSVESGPQTTNPAALAAVHRRFDERRYLQGMRACQEQGIAVEADLIIGLPEDSANDVIRSIDFAVEAGVDILQVSTLRVLPGTDLWDRAEELGIIFDEDGLHEIIATPTLSYSELRHLEVYGLLASKLLRSTW